MFELQDRVAISVAGVIEPTLQAAEVSPLLEVRPTRDLTAYDLYLRALPLWRSLNKSTCSTRWRSLRSDRTRSAVWARPRSFGCLPSPHRYQRVDRKSGRQPQDRRRPGPTCIARRGDDPDVLAYSGFALGYFGEDISLAMALIDRALKLNANFARGWFWSGWVRLYAGEGETAIKHFETSVRLSPRDRWAIHLTGIGIAHFFAHRFDEAAAKLRVSLEEIPGHATTYRFLAACYAHMGKLDDARNILERLRALTPVIMPSLTNFRNPEDRALLLAGLRSAEAA